MTFIKFSNNSNFPNYYPWHNARAIYKNAQRKIENNCTFVTTLPKGYKPYTQTCNLSTPNEKHKRIIN